MKEGKLCSVGSRGVTTPCVFYLEQIARVGVHMKEGKLYSVSSRGIRPPCVLP